MEVVLVSYETQRRHVLVAFATLLVADTRGDGR